MMALTAECVELTVHVAKLPQQPPFRFITGVVSLKELDLPLKGVTVEAYLDVTQEMCAGHFPDALIFPGVLLEEALGQTGCLALSCHADFSERDMLPMWNGPRSIEQNHSVFPEDRVRLRCSFVFEEEEEGRIQGRMRGQAFVTNGKGNEVEAMGMSANFLLVAKRVMMRMANMERVLRTARRSVAA